MNANAPIRNSLAAAHEIARRVLQNSSALEIVLDAASRRPSPELTTYATENLAADLANLQCAIANLSAALAPHLGAAIRPAPVSGAGELIREPIEDEA
jgi:hypothetical protein